MAAVSYLQNIDTRPFDFKPYKLPWEAVMKEQMVKTQQFASSAAQIQQAYKRNLDLDPQFEQNKDYLKNYMLDANNKLSKLVKSDMTIHDNAIISEKVYTDIYDVKNNPRSEALIMDDGINKFYKSEMQKSEAAKGSGTWSEKNDFWMKNQYQQYINGAKNGEDVNKLQDHWQNKKSYIPYYDGRKELEDIQKSCHADKSSEDHLGGISDMLKTTIVSNGVSSEKMSSCLNMASRQLKQQNSIDSYYDYFNNPKGLLDDYKSLVVDRYDNTAKQAELALLALRSNKKITPEQLKEAEDHVKVFQQDAQEANRQWNQAIGSNPLDYVKKNLERISSTVGWSKYQSKMGEVLSWKDVKKEYSTNAAGLAIFNANQQTNMQQLRFNHEEHMQDRKDVTDVKMAIFKGNIDLAKDGMSIDPNTLEIIGANGKSVNSLGGDAGSQVTNLKIDETELPNIMKVYGEEKVKLSSGVHDAYNILTETLSNYVKNHPDSKGMRISNSGDLGISDMVFLVDKLDKNSIKDTFVLGALKEFRKANQAYKVFKMQEDNLISTLPDVGNETHNFSLSRSMSTPLPVTFTDRELSQLYNGIGARGYTYDRSGTFDKIITPDGQSISVVGEQKFISAMQNVISKNKDFQESLNKGMTDWWVSRDGMFNLKPLPKKQNDERKSRIDESFGINDKSDIMLSDIKQDKNGTGYARVSMMVKDDKDNKTQVFADAKKLEELFPGADIKKYGNEIYLKKDGVFSPLPDILDTDNLKQINTYTENMLSKIKKNNLGRGYLPESLDFTSPSGTNFQVTMGWNGINEKPTYKLQVEFKGKLLEEPVKETSDVNAILYKIQTS